MQHELFGDVELGRRPEPVLMSLNPTYYELIWQGRKRHEFRRRYLTGRRTTWYVYLTAPVSCLRAVIDLDEAIADTPQRIAEIAEHAQVGNGASVYDYLRDLERGFALPITRVREYPSLTSAEAFDSGVLLGKKAAERLIDHARQCYAAARRVETVEAIRALPILRTPSSEPGQGG